MTNPGVVSWHNRSVATTTLTAKQHAHQLIDRIPADELVTAVRFLEFMASNAMIEDEEIGEDEEQTVARSKEWYKRNDGIPFENVVAELGFTMEQIRDNKDPE